MDHSDWRDVLEMSQVFQSLLFLLRSLLMTLAGPNFWMQNLSLIDPNQLKGRPFFLCVDVFLWAPLFPFSYLQNVLNHSLPLARSALPPGFESKRDNPSRSFTVQQIHLCVTWLV